MIHLFYLLCPSIFFYLVKLTPFILPLDSNTHPSLFSCWLHPLVFSPVTRLSHTLCLNHAHTHIPYIQTLMPTPLHPHPYTHTLTSTPLHPHLTSTPLHPHAYIHTLTSTPPTPTPARHPRSSAFHFPLCGVVTLKDVILDASCEVLFNITLFFFFIFRARKRFYLKWKLWWKDYYFILLYLFIFGKVKGESYYCLLYVLSLTFFF